MTSAIFVSSAMMWTIPGWRRRSRTAACLSAAVEAAGLHPLRNSAPSVALAGYREPSAIFLLGTHTILTDGRGAAELEDDAPRAVIVEKREEPIFLQRTAELGSDAEPLAVIGGLNYSNGDEVLLRVYRVGARTQKAEAK
ncbi:MAG: hypothetical protein R3C42_09220 [Parvularculaceae bacterium]